MRDFLLETVKVFIHRARVLINEIYPRCRSCDALGDRDARVDVGRQVLPFFVEGLLIGELLQVDFLRLDDAIRVASKRRLRRVRERAINKVVVLEATIVRFIMGLEGIL